MLIVGNGNLERGNLLNLTHSESKNNIDEESDSDDEEESEDENEDENDNNYNGGLIRDDSIGYGDIPLDPRGQLVGISELELRSILQFVDISNNIEQNYEVRFITFVHNFRTFIILFLITWTLLFCTDIYIISHSYFLELQQSNHYQSIADYTKRVGLAFAMVIISWCIYPFMELCQFFYREIYHIDLKSIVSGLCLYLIIEYIVNQLQRLQRLFILSYIMSVLCFLYTCLIRFFFDSSKLWDWALDLLMIFWLCVLTYIFIIFIRQIRFVQNSVHAWLQIMKNERLKLINAGKNILTATDRTWTTDMTSNPMQYPNNTNNTNTENTNCCMQCWKQCPNKKVQEWKANPYPNGRMKAYSRYFIEPDLSSPLPPPSKPPLENIYFAKPDRDEEVSYLKIKILSAHYLRELCNTCVIHLNDKTSTETKKCARSDNPVWDDMLIFRNVDISQIPNLRISIWDKTLCRSKEIAKVMMDTTNIYPNQIRTHILDLMGNDERVGGIIVLNTILLPCSKP